MSVTGLSVQTSIDDWTPATDQSLFVWAESNSRRGRRQSDDTLSTNIVGTASAISPDEQLTVTA